MCLLDIFTMKSTRLAPFSRNCSINVVNIVLTDLHLFGKIKLFYSIKNKVTVTSDCGIKLKSLQDKPSVGNSDHSKLNKDSTDPSHLAYMPNNSLFRYKTQTHLKQKISNKTGYCSFGLSSFV